MSINTVNYTMQLRPEADLDKKKRRVYARPVFRGKCNSKEIASELVHATTLTEADIMAVMTGLSEKLVAHLRRGELVTLDGIGSFGVRLKSEQGKDAKGKLRMDDLHVSGVLFRPADEFLTKVQNVEFKLIGGARLDMPSDEEIELMLRERFAKTDYITCSQIARALQVSRRRSYQIVERLVEQNVLARRGVGPTTHYVLNERS